MDTERVKYLETQALEIRKRIVKSIASAGMGHIGGAMSIVETLTVLYHDVMNIDPTDPGKAGRDLFVLSKGHAGPALYATLASKGYFPEEWLLTLNQPDTQLPSHPDMILTPGVDMSTGSLGQGISCAVGMAIGAKIKGGGEYIYTIIGDGESQEGTVWEASMAAAQYKLNHLFVFLDYNKLQIDGTVDEVMSLEDPEAKWAAFGFHTYRTDGHDVAAIGDTIQKAKAAGDDKPIFVALDTVKGKGISFSEDAGVANHAMPVSDDLMAKALKELETAVI